MLACLLARACVRAACTAQVCNHPDLFEGRTIVSAFDMPPLEVHLPSLVQPACVRTLSLDQEAALLVQEGIAMAGACLKGRTSGVCLCACVSVCVCVCECARVCA